MPFESKQLSENVHVAGQVSVGELPAIKSAGIKSIIINRPDNEGPDQPSADEIKQAAEGIGIAVEFVQMFPGQLTIELIQDMSGALERLPKPTLAYCASGTRSTILWCCANVGSLGVDAVLSSASAAGYNLEQFRPILTQLSQ